MAELLTFLEQLEDVIEKIFDLVDFIMEKVEGYKADAE